MGTYNIYEVEHDGHFLGGKSIVVAADEAAAVELTKLALPSHGLKTEGIRVRRRLSLDFPKCFVIDDGNY